MRTLLALAVLALFAAGQERTPAVPILRLATSYKTPTGGRLVVGVLVPSPPPRVVAAEIPKEKMDAFLAAEKKNEAESDEEEIEEPEPGMPAEIIGRGGHWAGPVRKVLQAARARLGIEILAREVTAAEIGQVPVLYLGERKLEDGEREAILRYLDKGGITCRMAARLETACARALDRVPRASVDPTRKIEARRVDGMIEVTVEHTPVSAKLLDVANETLWEAAAPAKTFRVPAPKSNLKHLLHRVELRWNIDGVVFERTHTLESLVGIVERRLYGSTQAVAGGTYGARAVYVNSTNGRLVSGRSESWKIIRGTDEIATAETTSDAQGTVDLRLRIPENTEPGRAMLVVGDTRLTLHIRREYRLSIVTDRSLYRPTDTVHARVLVHRFPSGRPAAGAKLDMRYREGRRTLVASDHGIASMSFALDEARPGEQWVAARIDRTEAKTRFRVQAFEKPLYKLTLDTNRLRLRPGEEAPVVLSAHYFNGSPVVGADVHGVGKGKTGPDGTYRFIASGTKDITLTVRTADKRYRYITLPIEVITGPRVHAKPAGDIVKGFPATIAIDPPDAKVLVNGEAVKVVDGRCTVTPTTPRLRVRVSAGVEEVFDFGVVDAILRPDRRIATVGETLRVHLRGADAPWYVDVERDGVIVRTLSTRERFVDVALDADLAGPVVLHAYRFDGKKTEGSRARVLVRRGRELTVKATPDKPEYRPGGTAHVDVTVTDKMGAPVAAALGYWAVDEAILALSHLPDGHETVFDGLAPKPTRGMLRAAKHGDAAALGAIESGRYNKRFTLRHDELTGLRKAAAETERTFFKGHVAELFAAYLKCFEKIPFADVRLFGSFREQIYWLVREGYLDAKLLRDPWGRPLVLTEDKRGTYFQWSSSGPHLHPGALRDEWSADDMWELMPDRMRRFLKFAAVHAEWMRDSPFVGPSGNSAIGLGGGAGGGRRGRGGRRNLRAGGGSGFTIGTGTRRDFPPTLVFVPEVLTDAAGRARLAVPLADSVTDWRMRLVASARSGATGIGFTKLRVTQPLIVEPWIARHLTVGDVLELPVAVRNETEAGIKADVELTVSEHLAVVGPRTAQVVVGPRGTGAHTFMLRAVKPGTAEVVIGANSGANRDRVARIVHVHRNARAIDTTESAPLDGVWRQKMKGEMRLDLNPGPIADTLSGFDALIREPHG